MLAWTTNIARVAPSTETARPMHRLGADLFPYLLLRADTAGRRWPLVNESFGRIAASNELGASYCWCGVVHYSYKVIQDVHLTTCSSILAPSSRLSRLQLRLSHEADHSQHPRVPLGSRPKATYLSFLPKQSSLASHQPCSSITALCTLQPTCCRICHADPGTCRGQS